MNWRRAEMEGGEMHGSWASADNVSSTGDMKQD